MSGILNLRQARKRRRRAEEREAASRRAAAFGESAAERRLRVAAAGIAERRLDQHRIEADPPDGGRCAGGSGAGRDPADLA